MILPGLPAFVVGASGLPLVTANLVQSGGSVFFQTVRFGGAVGSISGEPVPGLVLDYAGGSAGGLGIRLYFYGGDYRAVLNAYKTLRFDGSDYPEPSTWTYSGGSTGLLFNSVPMSAGAHTMQLRP